MAFAVPGELSTLTGGTIYDARLIAGLRTTGRAVRHLALPAGFPDPDPATVQASLAALAALPPDLPAIVDGLAFGALPTDGLSRILAPLVAGLETDEAALRRAFGPAVFATDRALELVAAGVPFREAYHEVKANLDRLTGKSPDEALAAKRHLGAPLGLDFAALAARAKGEETWAAAERRRHQVQRNRLLGFKA